MIEKGEGNIGALETLVELSRELHERTIILRYKAFEQKIFGPEDSNHDPKMDISTSLDETEERIELVEMEPEESVMLTFSFNFDDAELDEKKESSVEIVDRLVEESDLTSTSIDPTKHVNFEKDEEIFEDSELKIPHQEEAKKEPILEEVIVSVNSNTKWTTVINGVLKSNEGSFRSQLLSLSGSFGLNERLLYINELFDGNADGFSALISSLDSKTSWSECKQLLESTAEQNDWDENSDTVHEFIVHAHRKYV